MKVSERHYFARRPSDFATFVIPLNCTRWSDEDSRMMQ